MLWIDTLRINQQDNTEKSKQVALMGKIYTHACHVMLWLGADMPDSINAFSLMQHWADQFDVDWENETLKPSRSSTELSWGDVNIRLPYTNGELDAVRIMMSQPYFKRMWIRQEVALATLAIVQYSTLR